MATNIYETIPISPDETPKRFEIYQRMKDAPLSKHPKSGVPVKRVIPGSYGFNVSGSETSTPAPSSSCCYQGGYGCFPN